MTRENNQTLDKTFVYEYNNIGNIVNVKTYDYTTGLLGDVISQQNFGYDTTNTDRLTNFAGTTVSYNTMGCPTTYNGHTVSWTRGKISKFSKGLKLSGIDNYYYSYNALGQRTDRSYTYTLPTLGASSVAMGTLIGYSQAFDYDQSGRLISESKSNQYYGESGSSDKIVYLYDANSIIGMIYTLDGATNVYYFQRNLLGDVVSIYGTGGNKVGEYVYDAWGNCTITLDTNGIASRNPIRYRGYYYDQDMKLYYLNARYYSPEWRRFISPDNTAYLDIENANGLNLYTYCNNDPVNYYDPSGYALETVFDIGFAIWSLIDFIKDPTWANAGWLALDVVALVVPFLPAGGKVITKADDLLDVVGFVNKYDEVIVLGQSMTTRVIPYADEIGAAVYGGLTNFKDLEKAYGTVLATFIGYSDNMPFIIKESLKGAKFIDIGFDATRTLKGLKGMDLFTEIASIVTIHSERFFAQLFRKKNVFRYFRHKIF